MIFRTGIYTRHCENKAKRMTELNNDFLLYIDNNCFEILANF